MKALYLENIGELAIKEIPFPALPDGGAILRVKSAAICGTDLKIFKFGHDRISLPWVLGHEVSGILEDVDDPTGYYKPGDRVVLNPTVYCGRCYYCKRGMYNICLNPNSYGYERPGGFSEYISLEKDTIQRRELYPISEKISFDEAALAEPFACVINGHKDLTIKPESLVIIIGAGPIGIMHSMYTWARGARSIWIYDINEKRAGKAIEFSHIEASFSNEDRLKKELAYVREGIGADVVIVAAPSIIAQNLALSIVRKRGEVLFFAGLPKGGSQGTINTNLIHYKELKVFGSSNSTGLTMESALSFISFQKQFFSRIITARFPLEKAKDAFATAFSSSSYKVIINP